LLIESSSLDEVILTGRKRIKLCAILTLVLLMDRSISPGAGQPNGKKVHMALASVLVSPAYGATIQFNIGVLAPGQETRVDVRLTRL
jgi:hypothetical protein